MSEPDPNARPLLDPPWIPFGGMPAPTREIVEALQAKLENRREDSSIFEQMQGLCTTWSFLKITLQPVVKEYLRQEIPLLATSEIRHGDDDYPTTLAGQNMLMWQMDNDQDYRTMYESIFPALEANTATGFLLEEHTPSVTLAGEVVNPFAGVAMPFIDQYPFREYPPMEATIFPVPLTLRRKLMLDFMANTSNLMRNSHRKHRLIEPFHEPVQLYKPPRLKARRKRPRRARNIYLYHCPAGVKGDGNVQVIPHTVSCLDLLGPKGFLTSLSMAKMRREASRAGYYVSTDEYWFRYVRLSDGIEYHIASDHEVRLAFRDAEAREEGDYDELVLDVVGGKVPPAVAERRLEL